MTGTAPGRPETIVRPYRPTLATLALSSLLGAPTASAAGLELLPGGTRSIARGGATAAQPADAMLLLQNPAGMAYLDGNHLMLDIDVPLHDMCVDPYGYYGWGVYGNEPSEFGDPTALDDPNNPTIGATYATTPLGRVCNSASPFPIPQLAWAGKITDRLALGFGFVASDVVPGLQYGGDDGTVQTPYGPRPTPTRYSVVKQEVTDALGTTFGAAYRIAPWLSAGASLQILMARAQATQVLNAFGGTKPATDVLATVTTQDFFVPAAVFSLHARPIAPLDLTAGFRWSDDLRGSGDSVFETNTFHRGTNTDQVPFKNDPIRLAEATVRFPWQLTAGARYRGLLRDAEEGGDPIDTERWDIEVDFNYTFQERTSLTSARTGEAATLLFKTVNPNPDAPDPPSVNPRALVIDRHLTDVYTVRVGASYAVLPRQVMLMAGGYFESRGVDPAYADIDTFSFQRVGVGTGVVWRLGAIDLRAAYGHIFSETLEVAPPPHQPKAAHDPTDPRSGFDKRVGGEFGQEGQRIGGVVLEDPDAPAPENADAVAAKTQHAASSTAGNPDRVINAGRYTAAFNLVSVGVVYHF